MGGRSRSLGTGSAGLELTAFSRGGSSTGCLKSRKFFLVFAAVVVVAVGAVVHKEVWSPSFGAEVLLRCQAAMLDVVGGCGLWAAGLSWARGFLASSFHQFIG